MAELVNLTSYQINVVDQNGNIIMTLEKSEKPLRLLELRYFIDLINEKIPLNKLYFLHDYELPKKKDGIYYVVSGMIAEIYKRSDFIVPDHLIRLEEDVIFCLGFCFYGKPIF
jgi:hypothetical protein